jgi:hypothetical protein
MDYHPISAPSVEHKLYKRGQLSDWDFAVGDLTTDGNWHELDWTGKVPSGTVAVYISGMLSDDVANTYIFFGENGYTPIYNIKRQYVPAANQPIGLGFWVGLDANLKCKYKTTNTTISVCNFNAAEYIK